MACPELNQNVAGSKSEQVQELAGLYLVNWLRRDVAEQTVSHHPLPITGIIQCLK